MSEEQDEVEGTENSEEQDDDDNDALELEGKDEVLEVCSVKCCFLM